MLVAVVCVGAILLARAVPPLPGLLVAYGRFAATWVGINQIVYVGEGITAAVAVSRTPEWRRQLPQRGQDSGVERATGHAAAADARSHHDAGAEEPGARCS